MRQQRHSLKSRDQLNYPIGVHVGQEIHKQVTTEKVTEYLPLEGGGVISAAGGKASS